MEGGGGQEYCVGYGRRVSGCIGVVGYVKSQICNGVFLDLGKVPLSITLDPNQVMGFIVVEPLGESSNLNSQIFESLWEDPQSERQTQGGQVCRGNWFAFAKLLIHFLLE